MYLCPTFFKKRRRLKQKIIEKLYPLFQKKGPKSLTMNEISESFGMSKKTLYQYFPNKEELLMATVAHGHERIMEIIHSVQNQKLPAIQEMYVILDEIYEFLQTDEDIFMFQLLKYYPEIYQCCSEFIHQFIYRSVYNNIEKGILEQVYRAELDKDLSTKIFIMNIMSIKTSEIFEDSSQSRKNLTKFVLDFFLNSITTGLGKDQLNQTSAEYEI